MTNAIASLFVAALLTNDVGNYATNGAWIHPTTEQTVKRLAESGEICKVYGHWFLENGVIYTTFPATYDRTCRLCKKTETLTFPAPVPWEWQTNLWTPQVEKYITNTPCIRVKEGE